MLIFWDVPYMEHMGYIFSTTKGFFQVFPLSKIFDLRLRWENRWESPRRSRALYPTKGAENERFCLSNGKFQQRKYMKISSQMVIMVKCRKKITQKSNPS